MGTAGGWAAEEVKPVSDVPEKYIRMTMNPDRPKVPQSLDTSIIRFVPKDEKLAKAGVSVDLIGAIHIGDQGYFQQLNSEFEKYDALLYEMVADKDDLGGEPVRFVDREAELVDKDGTTKPKEPATKDASEESGFKAGMAVVGGMQLGAKDMLGLAFQVDWIDYSAKNMVHADMSPEEFAEGHLAGSVNVGIDGRYATWAGTVLEPDRALVLVAPEGREDQTAVVREGGDGRARKLIVNWERGTEEAYDLSQDPGETSPMDAQGALWDDVRAGMPGPPSGGPAGLDPETERKLRALGYME